MIAKYRFCPYCACGEALDRWPMAQSTGQVGSDAATFYEELFVPALFAQWGPRMADALGALPGERGLDVACGTGVLARELANRLGGTNVTGVDTNDGMLAVARTRAPEIQWRSAHADALPFDDGCFDVVGCQFGLMFFPDRAAALAEMWRVLEPGGRLAVAVWASLEDTPAYATVVAMLKRLFGEDVANELRAPFCLGDRDALAELFRTANIPDANIATTIGDAKFASIRAWVDADAKAWTLAERLDPEQYDRLQREAQSALAGFTNDEGRVVFDSPAHIVTATKR